MKLENGQISIEVASHGAELMSLRHNGREYLWQGDSQYWGRRSPILFPIVGQVWRQTYRVDGNDYHLPQHGFARDCNFEPIDESEGLTFRLRSNDTTKELYPYDFELIARYTLHEKTLRCSWTVKNTGGRTMFYQIGAHPGFLYRDFDPEDRIHGMIAVQNLTGSAVKPIIRGIVDGGFRAERSKPAKIYNVLALDHHTFDHDAILLEDGQTKIVTLSDKHAKAYLRLTSDCQVFGIWSPSGKNAPFVCIEPWMGRCDKVGFEGDISQRDFIQQLGKNEEREFIYSIEILD